MAEFIVTWETSRESVEALVDWLGICQEEQPVLDAAITNLYECLLDALDD